MVTIMWFGSMFAWKAPVAVASLPGERAAAPRSSSPRKAVEIPATAPAAQGGDREDPGEQRASGCHARLLRVEPGSFTRYKADRRGRPAEGLRLERMRVPRKTRKAAMTPPPSIAQRTALGVTPGTGPGAGAGTGSNPLAAARSDGDAGVEVGSEPGSEASVTPEPEAGVEASVAAVDSGTASVSGGTVSVGDAGTAAAPIPAELAAAGTAASTRVAAGTGAPESPVGDATDANAGEKE
jgi:hypothetical protein